jgi:cytochrome b
MSAQRVWDLPLRLFHWGLALAVVSSVVTAKLGGNAMEWHLWLGQLVMGLLVFRVLWGLWGGHWSRFRTWPLAFWRHRGAHSPSTWVGHAPSGAWASLALLGLLALQVLSGLTADDEIATAGPWAAWVSSATASTATTYHHAWGQWLILGMVGLHLSAIAFYAWVKRRPLVPAMWHGNKPLVHDVEAARVDGPAVWRRAALLATLAAAMVWASVA